MKKNILADEKIEPAALAVITSYHSGIVNEVSAAVNANKVVVVGMAQNPFVKKITKALNDHKIPFTYLEYGSYFSLWKPRLAIKLWSGWPTFPQVFVSGNLVGGCAEALELLKSGKIPK